MKKFQIILCSMMALAATSCGTKAEKAETKDAANLARIESPAFMKEAADSLWRQAESDSLELHSLMIVNDGKVVYEQWRNGADAKTKHILNSVSKTFTSIAVGMAIDEGKLSLDDKVAKIFPEYLPENVSANLADMDVRDLLTMTCGHATDHTYEMQEMAKTDTTFNWVKQFLSYPVEYRPGEIYCYNSVGSLMLSAIVQKITGESLIDYLRPRLFEPLHIEDPCWETTKNGICYGGWGLYLKTEDLAKTGQLILQKGKWDGKQLISESWVNEMTRMQVESSPAGINLVELAQKDASVAIDPDWIQGYGYQMWMCRNNAFRADGARGQYIIVLPDQNSVIAMTANTVRMQDELNLVWKYILPAINKLNNN